MINVIIFLTVFAVLVAIAARTIAKDGYGSRPGPRSHRDEADQPQHYRLIA